MRVTYLGVGEAFDTELANTSLLVETAGSTILLDCGYSVPQQFWRRVQDPEKLDAVYLTHQHADHYLGIPALLVRFFEDGRKKPLVVCGHPALAEAASGLLDLAFPNLREKFTYAVRFVGFTDSLSIGDATLRIAQAEHPVPNCAVRVSASGKALCYSGDGTPTPATEKLFAGADLLAHEAFKREEEKFGHGSMRAVKALATKLGLRDVDLVHINRTVRRQVKENAAFVKGWARIPEQGESRTL